MADSKLDQIRILIADDHAIVREGLATILATTPDIEVIGEARDGPDAISKAAELLPDVVLMDVRMGGFDDGVEATRRLKSTTPNAKVIMLTNYDEDEHVYQSMRAGANGYLLKEVTSSELINAIRTVAQGYSIIYPSIARRVLSEFSERRAEPTVVSQPIDDLTPREQEVLGLVAQGRANKEIASKLCITERTVKTHMSNILSKLQMSDRTQAALYAVKRGMVQDQGGAAPPRRY